METNNRSKDRPVMTSGITRGAETMPVKRVLPRKRRKRTSATAANVPSTNASEALMARCVRG